jgi:pimeloyl-ACP methyl ester carboxylesterase
MQQPSLQPALGGERRESQSEPIGLLSWYQDAPAPASVSESTPLLLIHSINAAASAFEMKPLYDLYRQQRPVFAPDLPGYGFSERSRRYYGPRLMTDAIHALCAEIQRQYGPVPIDAMALSLSAEFLARAATEKPAMFRRIALISPTGFNRPLLREGPPGSTRGLPKLLAFFSRPSIGRRLFRLLTRRPVIRYFLRRTWGSRHIDEGLLDYDCASAAMPGAEHAPLHFLSGFLFSGDSGRLYLALGHPVWAVHGIRGDFVDYRGLAQLQGKTNWQIEVFPTGALPHFEQPREFVERYDAWCAATLRQDLRA